MRGVAYDPVLRAKLMVMHQHGVTFQALSAEFGIRREVLSRWWTRYRTDDLVGLQPRSRRPRHSPQQLRAAQVRSVLRLRARGQSAARIAWALGLGQGTVQRVLERAGQSRLPRPARPRPKRYEKDRPGELLHIDIKFLPALRNARYDYEFAAVDDFSREAVVWIALDQTSASATVFLERVLATLPYRIEAVLTDNALAFTMRHAHHADRLSRFDQACRSLGIAHHLLRPYAPQSNGKVERFFRTIDDECLAQQRRWTFQHRTRAVDRFVWFYNHERPHLSLGGMTPVDRRKLFFRQAKT
jgi:transposase InsO family protein